MTNLTVEIIKARYQISRASSLRKIAKLRRTELVAEMQRGDNLRIIADEILAPSIHPVLLTLPTDGSWVPGSGREWRIISDLLDEDSPLIEEDEISEDSTQWRVRLTDLGIAAVTAQQASPYHINPRSNDASRSNSVDGGKPHMPLTPNSV